MKVLIAYDGSDSSQAALDDLAAAGLPADCDVDILTAIDTWAIASPQPGYASPMLGDSVMAIEAAAQIAQAAAESARQAAGSLRQRLAVAHPTWKIAATVAIDTPQSSILRRADAFHADLVVLGSHGRSALSRLVLGSVSQSVLSHAHCSVRIGRARRNPAGSPLKLVVGVDGSPGSDAAIAHLIARPWPAGTTVLALAVVDVRLLFIDFESSADWDAGIRAAAAKQQTQLIADAAVKKLRAAGLSAEPAVRDGDPKRIILAEADRFAADCIFLGARGHSRLERLLLGSVSTAIANQAHCSVEVVKHG